VAHVQRRVYQQGVSLGFAPAERPARSARSRAIMGGLLLLARSQFARSKSRLDHNYLEELGFRKLPR
jgi:hypothetical protein